MTAMLASATTDPFGIAGTFPVRVRRTASSTVDVGLLGDTIRRVLESWEQFKAAPVNRYAAVPAQHMAERPYPETPLEAVNYLRDLLQVSRDAVLAAVGIAERTFYGWQQNPDARPRAASTGSLWNTLETLHRLDKAHPNLAAWYHANSDAQDAFLAGQMNRLLQVELEWISTNAADLGLRNTTATAVVPAPFGDDGDEDPATGTGGHAEASGIRPELTSQSHRLRRTMTTAAAPASEAR